jgi:hypothetical protein
VRLHVGMPLVGYANPADRNEEQRAEGDAFIVDVSASLQRRFGLRAGMSLSGCVSDWLHG